jgi:hypothetical protein
LTDLSKVAIPKVGGRGCKKLHKMLRNPLLVNIPRTQMFVLVSINYIFFALLYSDKNAFITEKSKKKIALPINKLTLVQDENK